jgi:hypothetical protein
MHTTHKLLSLGWALLLSLASCGDDELRDMTPPAITGEGITCNPINCQVYQPGDSIPFLYVFEDDTELGSFNIEIHNNFDHHTHSTEGDDHEGSECEDEHEEEHHTPQKPWVYNQSYAIPEGQKRYVARIDIPIPADIDEGDYHFMIRLTDRAGWQQIKGIAIKVERV